MSFKVLVVDDNIDDRDYEIYELPAMLEAEGYEVVATADGDGAYDLVWEWHPDLIVLDVEFDGQPVGIDILEAIRRQGCSIPVILVTKYRTETADVLRGFEADASDYVTRPCDNRVIVARVRANLPREGIDIDGYILVDRAGRRVWIRPDGDWQRVDLQPLQFDLLDVLVLNIGLIVPSTTLKDRVWGRPVSDNLLAVYIRRLREKLEPDPDHPIYIETVKGIGYRFNGKPTRASGPLPAR